MKRIRLFLANVGRRKVYYPQTTPPIGLLYLAAFLRDRFPLDIQVFNQRLSNCPNETVVREAIAFEADVIGLGALTPFAHNMRDIAQALRVALPHALIVLGGAHPSAAGAAVLQDTVADVAVTGEGELTFEAVLRAHVDGADFSGIPGLIWRDRAGEVIVNPGAAPQIEDLDSLPFPAYDLVDMKPYWRTNSAVAVPRRRYVSLVSSRGCPYHCSWCHQIFGKRFRGHSPERVVAEIEHFTKRFGVNDIDFLDDIFNHNLPRFRAILDLLLKKGIKVRIAFPSGLRADILTEDDVKALADAGTYYAAFALESGSPRIQQLMGKKLNIPRFLQTVAAAAKHRIFVYGFNILGFPTETEAEMQMTIDTACASELHVASFYLATPFPNTELYRIAAETRPESLANLQFDDMDCATMHVNVSDMSDDVLFRYQRMANRRFYSNPRRIVRIIRDYPQPYFLPMYLPRFISGLTRGLMGSR